MSSKEVISSAGRPLSPGAIALMLMLCVTWGFNQIAVKLVLPEIPPMLQAALRSTGALPVLLLVGSLRGVKFFERDGTLWAGLLAGLMFGIEFVLVYQGLRFTSASRAAVFLYTAPFFVAFGSHQMLGERLSTAQWGGLALSFLGVALAIGVPQADVDVKVLLGDLHILDENMGECPTGKEGTVWFKTATPFEYFNDPEKTREARSADGTMSTVGDVGYVDGDGYLYLTDRRTFMIISGGVNIYPQECENLLITHPKIADAAVFGVPNADLGEEVKAVVQPMPGVAPCEALAAELIAFCSRSLARQKAPRSIDFEAELPRLPTGKLYKRLLRDRYWDNKSSRIV